MAFVFQNIILLKCSPQYSLFILALLCVVLTLNLLTTTIVAPPSNASKCQMGFNSAFKGLNIDNHELRSQVSHIVFQTRGGQRWDPARCCQMVRKYEIY